MKALTLQRQVTVAPRNFKTAEFAYLKSLENSGRWAEIVGLYEERKETSYRLMGGAFRAFAFLGNHVKKCDELRQSLTSVQNELDFETLGVWMLGEAALARQMDQHANATAFALKALSFGKSIQNKDLVGDAEFALAISLDESGRIYLALDKFQLLSRDESLSPYRRGLSALNEAWSLWDLGCPQAIRRILHLIPAAFRARVDLMLAVIEMDSAAVSQQLRADYSDICETERTWLATILIEWLFLTTREFLPTARKGWLPRFCQNTENPMIRKAWSALVDDTPIKDTPNPLGHNAEKICWRNQVDEQFMIMLSWLKTSPRMGLEIYQNAIDPILEKQGVNVSLIPRFDSLSSTGTPWVKRLHYLLGLVPFEKTFQVRVKMSGQEIEIVEGAISKRFSLVRSPQSKKLLRLLMGPAGRLINKKFLHEQLTGSKYAPHLHDDRLYKLLGRIVARIQNETGYTLWDWSGQNAIKLRYTFETFGDESVS